MNQKASLKKVTGIVCVFLFLALGVTTNVPAQSTIEPKLDHSACVFHCMMDQNFLHTNSNYESASNQYYAFMQRFWENSSCEGVGIVDVFEAVTAISGVPGGASLKCWDLLLAQTHRCAKS